MGRRGPPWPAKSSRRLTRRPILFPIGFCTSLRRSIVFSIFCKHRLCRARGSPRFDPPKRNSCIMNTGNLVTCRRGRLPRHVLRSRVLRRHRRPHLAQADAGAVPGLAARQTARGRPHPLGGARRAQRRRPTASSSAAFRRGRQRQAPERRGIRAFRRAAALPPHGSLAARALRRAEAVGDGAQRRHGGAVPRHQPAPVPADLRSARQGRPERPERARGAGEAARPRPRQRARDQPRGARRLPRGTRRCASTTTSANRRCRT